MDARARPRAMERRRRRIRDHVGDSRQRLYGPAHGGELSRHARDARRVSVHARHPADHVPRPATGRCASTPASAPPKSRTSATATCSSRAHRPQRRVRSAHADGPRLRPRARARRGRQGRRGHRLARRHGGPLRRHPARQGHDLDDHQRDGVDPARVSTSRWPRSRASAWDKVGGTIQNDMLKEYIARGTYIYPPSPSMRLITDIFAFCTEHVPQLEHDLDQRLPHPRGRLDGGAGGRVHARRRDRLRARRRSTRARRRRRSPAGCRSSSTCHNNFFEEVAKFRAARRMWARIMRERFGAKSAALVDAALPQPDGGLLADGAAAAQQRRAHDGAGARRGLRRHAVAAHQRLRRGARRCPPRRPRASRCARSRSSPTSPAWPTRSTRSPAPTSSRS